MKYMVMECHLSYAVVLAEDGTFLKVANLHYEVGQTVTEVIEMRQPELQSPPKAQSRWRYSLAAVAACLVLSFVSLFQMGQTPYGSVYLSINPAVRIDVNRKDKVIDIEGTNQDGERLIEDYRYKRKDLTVVMDELADRAIDQGFLHEGGTITLTLDAEDEQWIVSHEAALSSSLNRHLTEKISVTITVAGETPKAQKVVIPVAPEAEAGPLETESVSPETKAALPETETAPPETEEAAAPSASTVIPSPSYGESDYGSSDYEDDMDDDDMDEYVPDDDDADDDDPGDDDLDDDVPRDDAVGDSAYEILDSQEDEGASSYSDYEEQEDEDD